MDNFKFIRQYFEQLSCADCNMAFSPDGIELLHEEDGYWIIRINCLNCNQVAGIAIVGVVSEQQEEALQQKLQAAVSDLTHNDKLRFASRDPITVDDVLDAHSFFSQLDENWRQYLPPLTSTSVTVESDSAPDK